MAGIKRKGALDEKVRTEDRRKKQKNDGKRLETSNLELPLETETDSDPIVESETTSQSGEDEGASWPSDDEGGKSNEREDAIEDENGNEGTKIATEAPKEGQSKTKSVHIKGTSTSMFAAVRFYASLLTYQ